MSQAPISLPVRASPPGGEITLERLSDCVRSLDPGTRALLDLSVRRRIRDDAMATVLRTDPFNLAWRRARALERVASQLGGDRPAPLAEVRAALGQLPGEAWFARPQLMPVSGRDPIAPASRALPPGSPSGQARMPNEIVVRRPTQGEHRRLMVAGSPSHALAPVDLPRPETVRGRLAAAVRRAAGVLRKRNR